MEIDKLFSELSSRLQYGLIGKVTVEVTTSDIDMDGFHTQKPMDVDVMLSDINIDGYIKFIALDGSSEDLSFFIQQWSDDGDFTYNDFKPYLREISSLTEEECDKLFEILNIDEDGGDWLKINDINVIRLLTERGKDFYEIAEAIDYLNSIHIDYRNMIEDGLANKAPDGMYKL